MEATEDKRKTVTRVLAFGKGVTLPKKGCNFAIELVGNRVNGDAIVKVSFDKRHAET